MNEITWAELSYELKVCLGYLDTRFLTEVRSDIFEELNCLGLVTHNQTTDEDVLTDLGRVVLAQADTAQPEAGAGDFKQGDRILWIPHNHTGYIAEIDERDGLPCYYIELDMSDEIGYAKHESLRLWAEDYCLYPKEQSEVEKLEARITELESALQAAKAQADALAAALKPFAETWENFCGERVFINDSGFLEWYYNESDEENVTEMHKQAAAALQSGSSKPGNGG